MRFDEIIDRRGTNSTKWDRMERLFGVSPADGLAMWTADSDYPTAPCVIDAVRRAAEHGIFGYSWENPEYLASVQWWMKTRHNWAIETGCLKAENAGRQVVECPLARRGDTYTVALDDAQSRLDGSEKILIWCSPQNPSGRVWTVEELRDVAAFAARNNLILISDEVHHDLVYAGNTFVPMDVAAPKHRDRTVTLTAASKTFNIAGQRTGNLIIPDQNLRAAMKRRLTSLDYYPSALGVQMITAAYSPAGAAWVDAQLVHLEGNRKLFDEGVNAIPGVRSLPLQSTFLAWVDFAGTGMTFDEIATRIRDRAKIAVSPGPNFGAGGELCQRINLATQRATVADAVKRLQAAFSDLQ